MNGIALLAAAVGALVGALIWALISATTGYEVGYVAWGIGALVGFGAMKFRSSGAPMGVACAVLALAAIFGGKVLSVQVGLEDVLRETLVEQQAFTRANYEELCEDAKEFQLIAGADEYPDFMVDRGFTEAGDPGDISSEEVGNFGENTVPMLRQLAEGQSFEAWRRQQVDEAAELIAGQVSVVKVVIDNLNLIDLVFAFLGVATAFRLAAGGTSED